MLEYLHIFSYDIIPTNNIMVVMVMEKSVCSEDNDVQQHKVHQKVQRSYSTISHSLGNENLFFLLYLGQFN